MKYQKKEQLRQRFDEASKKKQRQDESLQYFMKSKVIDDQGLEYQDKESFKKNYEILMHSSRAFLCSLDILEESKLTAHARILFQIISSLSFNEGFCYASNEYLCKKIGKGEESVKRYLNELEKFGLIKRDTYNTKQGFVRNIHIQFQYIKQLYLSKQKK